MIKDVNYRLGDHIISPMIRQFLLNWVYQLIENGLK